MLPQCQELLLDLADGVLTITLNRPHKRNAMNSRLVNELMSVFAAIDRDRSVRAVVLQGAEGNFCAGGDISGMSDQTQSAGEGGRAAWEFNRSFGHMITQVNCAPQVVICLLQGAVFGGGFGLACISDLAIAHQETVFAMPETGLGIIPAQIAPFVVTRIGLTQARRLALLGERINGAQAVELGLVHHVCDSEQAMQDLLATTLQQVRRCAPQATAVTKALMLQVGHIEHETLLDKAADDFTRCVNSAEGKEGTRAFLDRRTPHWC